MGGVAVDEVTPEMLEAREKLRARMGVSGTQTGGKGTMRRKVKKTNKFVGDDKRLQYTLRSVGAANIPGIEEVQMIKDDGHVLTFHNPKVQAAPNANTYVISGVPEEKEISIPELLQHLSSAGFEVGNAAEASGADIPKLVEVFDDVSIQQSK